MYEKGETVQIKPKPRIRSANGIWKSEARSSSKRSPWFASSKTRYCRVSAPKYRPRHLENVHRIGNQAVHMRNEKRRERERERKK